MPLFTITALEPQSQTNKIILYNTDDNSLTWEDGNPIVKTIESKPIVEQVKIQKGKIPKRVKIQLGLSCNFECDYCNQRFVPHADETTNPSDVEPFVNNMKTWFDGGDDGFGLNRSFEFWGGEPFVYWKTFKPLAEKIHEQYPNAQKSVITNGSLLDKEKVDWLYKYGFSIAVSHDGPGQFVRGPDPLEDASSKEGIMYAFKLLAPEGRMSFNSMVNNKNTSRANIESYFVDLVKTKLGEDYLKFLVIGEGTFIDAYDEGGLSASLKDEEEELKFRNTSYNELREGGVKRFLTINDKVKSFINSVEKGSRKESLTQKCGMDLQENIAIDLNGNVLTCQNVSTNSTNPSGIAHHIGHVSDLANVEVKTGTHWSDRDECPKCPVVHICQGACFFLTGPLWEASCNNAYSDNVVMFATAIEHLTGHVPVYIDGPNRKDRKDIFWWVHGKPKNSSRKIIPINSI